MSSAVLALTLMTAAPAIADAPVKLYTPQGVEIRLDERVFRLFAALNAAGYAEEAKRRGPPLNAPVYHELRIKVRDELRKLRDADTTVAVREAFESNPQPVEAYLEAALAEKGTKLSKAGQSAARADPKLTAFYEAASVQTLFDTLAAQQRELAKELMVELSGDMETLWNRVGEEFTVDRSLVVVPNPLDSHNALYAVNVGNTRYLIVGPGFSSTRQNLVSELVTPYLRSSVNKAWGSASKYKKHWDQVKVSKRISKRYRDGKNYLTVALSRTLAYLVDAQRRNALTRESNEEFIDVQARESMRWARISLRVWEQHDPAVPFSEELPKLVAKYGP